MPLPFDAQGRTPLWPTGQTCCFTLHSVPGAEAVMAAADERRAWLLLLLPYVLPETGAPGRETPLALLAGRKTAKNSEFGATQTTLRRADDGTAGGSGGLVKNRWCVSHQSD